MNQVQKQQIQSAVNDYCTRFSSQAKAVATLKSVSEAIIINIRKDKWESISDEMWLNVGKQVGWSINGGWQLIQTTNYNTLTAFFEDAQEYHNVYAVIGQAGSGKSKTAQRFSDLHQHVYVVTCAEHWNRKIFLSKLLTTMSKSTAGLNAAEMLDEIIDTVIRQETPLIVLDEADKLNDQVLYFFISLYNALKDKCGIVLMATSYLEKRIKRGVQLNKKGYSEIYSRLGRKYVELDAITRGEIAAICEANGITSQAEISTIYNESEGDLRRVEKSVHRIHRLAERKKTA